MAKKTKAQSILALAGKLAGRDLSREYGTTITDAVDALNDALAGKDMKRGATISDAVLMVDKVVDEIAEDIAALKAAMQESGIDVGGGSIAEIVDAMHAYIDAGGDMLDDSDFATDDEVRRALGQDV